jgi:hypothetical protein
MPEGVGYKNYEFTSASPTSLNYIGNKVYGYSGAVAVDDNLTTVVEWTTGNDTIEALLQLNYLTVSSNDQMEWQIYLNSIQIAGAKNVGPAHYSEFDYPLHLIIPPRSTLMITCDNVSSSTARNMGALLTGTTL